MVDQGAAVRSPTTSARTDRVARASGESGLPEVDEAALAAKGTSTPDQPRVRMKQRFSRLGTSRPQTPALDPLFSIIKANHPKADLTLIERAYRVAEAHHDGQLRKSGDAYITTRWRSPPSWPSSG